MCVTQFRDLCQKYQFYYFKTLEDFEKKIDWCGVDVSKKKFVRDLVDDREYPPYCYSIYWLK